MTPTQQAAYETATLKRTGKAPADDRSMFASGLAHGITQERARCAKVARDHAEGLSWVSAAICADIADAIESPTPEGSPT